MNKQAQLAAWDDSVELTSSEVYDLVKYHDRWIVAMTAAVAQYPNGCFYLCGFDGKKYRNLGYRYDKAGHEYLSSFSNSEGWFMPKRVEL